MHQKELKTCPKCGEYYSGSTCVGCHSNQYAHYTSDTSSKHKVLVALAILVIIGLSILQR